MRNGSGRFTFAREIQDALAAVALNDAGVAADVVEYLRAKADVTDGAEAVFRFCDADTLSALGNLLERRERAAIDLGGEPLTCARRLVQIRLERGHLCVERAALGSNLLLDGFGLGFSLLQLGAEVVGLHHDVENPILSCADVGLCRFDFVQHRGVFTIGLHLEQLVLVLGQPRLYGGDFLFIGATLLLSRGQPRFDAGQGVAHRLKAGVEHLGAIGVLRNSAAGIFCSAVELLKLDEAFEILVHT